MAPLHSNNLSNLLLQAKFAPERQRLSQLDACEGLLRIIQKGKSYPFEFICYHLTGYRPKQQPSGQEMLGYETLLRDIPAYSEKISRLMRIRSDHVKGKFFTNASLAKHFRVSEKTISRWRSMGLAGRYLVYPDGRLRLAFSEESVDFFVRANQKRIEKGAAFSLIAPEEKLAIQHRLTQWAAHSPTQRQEAIRRTARKFNRSEEAIRSILTELEAQKSSNRFYKRTTGLDEEEAQAIYTAYRAGQAADELTSRFGRSRANIYRAINLCKSRELIRTPLFFIPSPEFLPQNSSRLMDPEPDLFDRAALPRTANPRKELNALDLDSLGAYINDIYEIPLLTGRQEFFLFRKFNYLKSLAEQERTTLDPAMPSGRSLNRIRLHLQQAREIQNQIIAANLRLVIHVARKHVRENPELLEYIAEGNLTLINAVDKFDFTRGNKFSTYATWAIIKRFATLKTVSARQSVCVSSDEALEVAANLRVPASQVAMLEDTRQNLDRILSNTLEEREQFVLREHYGLAGGAAESNGPRRPRSLTQIAERAGLSKERVRQIELYALKKLRKVLSVDQFELLTQV